MKCLILTASTLTFALSTSFQTVPQPKVVPQPTVPAAKPNKEPTRLKTQFLRSKRPYSVSSNCSIPLTPIGEGRQKSPLRSKLDKVML
jgi:hypothetical protein